MNNSINVNEYIRLFLASRGGNVLEEWNSVDNQQDFVKQFTTVSGSKKLKDPNAPKRGTSSYLFFCRDERVNVKSDFPDMSAKDITSEMGKRWNILKEESPELFSKYETLAEADRKRYNEQKANYIPSGEFSSCKSSKKKDPNAPKRGRSAYILFCAEERNMVKHDNPETSATAITSELGRRWNQLKIENPERIRGFEEMAVEDKERYEIEKKLYKGEVCDVKVKSCQRKTEEDDEEKSVTGYELFCKNKRNSVKKKNKDKKPKEITKELNKMWKSMSEKEQNKYF
jgi:hypothetical protein